MRWGSRRERCHVLGLRCWERGGIHNQMRQKREKMRLLVGGGTLVLRKWTSVVTDRVHWAWVSDLIAYIDFKSSITDSWQALAVRCWKPFLCVCAFLCNRGRMILKLNPGFPPKPVARNSRDLTSYSTICKTKDTVQLDGTVLVGLCFDKLPCAADARMTWFHIIFHFTELNIIQYFSHHSSLLSISLSLDVSLICGLGLVPLFLLALSFHFSYS